MRLPVGERRRSAGGTQCPHVRRALSQARLGRREGPPPPLSDGAPDGAVGLEPDTVVLASWLDEEMRLTLKIKRDAALLYVWIVPFDAGIHSWDCHIENC